MIKVTHIITGLAVGGAENMLYKLVSCMDRKTFDIKVISLSEVGPIGARIQALGIPVRALGMRPNVPDLIRLLRLARWLRQDRPHVVQTWMYHADLIGGLAARMSGIGPVAWNIRHSQLDPASVKRSTIWIGKTCARLSRRLPTTIVCCSEVGRDVHVKLGYDARKIQVIPNGFDLGSFRPNAAARLDVRQKLGIPETAFLIGLVGRFDPQKDHQNFVQAAALLHASHPEAHYLLCGDGVDWQNEVLAGWIDAAGLRSHFHLLGRRNDMPRISAALDIAASASSYGEGFPNVLGEAMACGIPCVATDVGDSARIIANTGRIVPLKDPQALADALRALIETDPEERSLLGTAARCRVQENFSLSVITTRYEDLYQELVKRCAV